MSMKTVGIIGCGNMGSAIAAVLARSVDPSSVWVADHTAAKCEHLRETLGVHPSDAETIVRTADWIVIGVKPKSFPSLMEQLSDTLLSRTKPFSVISMMAGYSLSDLSCSLPASCPVIRIMPNTPVGIGEGVLLYCGNAFADESLLQDFRNAFSTAGLLMQLPESQFDAAGTLSGCGPAFANLFIESLADGAVACGVPRKTALRLAAQMLVGSGSLLLHSDKHPGELKDAVCSPGGTTIQGVRILEERGFRGAAMDAVIAAYEKNRDLH